MGTILLILLEEYTISGGSCKGLWQGWSGWKLA
jgi:hypothetical protein